MTDRVPGAPGQYTMTVSAEEAQKLLTGEAVTVTLVRNDQPLVEGTPYNKASVLPDDLAAQICPDVADPTPADAFRGLLPRSGGEVTGPINMNSNAITGLREPSGDSDAATLKTVNKAKEELQSQIGGAKLLWTNSSPSSSFSAQTVTISGLSDYALKAIEFGGIDRGDAYCGVTMMGNVEKDYRMVWGDVSRKATLSGNSISFANASYGDVDFNDGLIPIRIYGIKVTV